MMMIIIMVIMLFVMVIVTVVVIISAQKTSVLAAIPVAKIEDIFQKIHFNFSLSGMAWLYPVLDRRSAADAQEPGTTRFEPGGTGPAPVLT
jgi:hypothetical protein